MSVIRDDDPLVVAQAQTQMLINELQARAAPALPQFMDSLRGRIALAQAGDPGSKAILGELGRLLEEARATAGGIVVVR